MAVSALLYPPPPVVMVPARTACFTYLSGHGPMPQDAASDAELLSRLTSARERMRKCGYFIGDEVDLEEIHCNTQAGAHNA